MKEANDRLSCVCSDPTVVTTTGANGDDWQKLFDPNLGIYFLYNTETGEKVYTDGLTKEEALEVAKTNYINRQVQLAEEATEALRARERERRLKENAVKTIANLLRTRKCRRIVQELIAQSYMKRLDPYNGNLYYYNLVKRKRVGKKPINLAQKVRIQYSHSSSVVVKRNPGYIHNLQDIKPLQWNLRLDGDGNAFYENAVSPWLSSSVKPAGILPCCECTYSSTRLFILCTNINKYNYAVLCLNRWTASGCLHLLHLQRAHLC